MVPSSTPAPRLRYTLPVFVLLSLAGFYFIVLHMVLSHAPDRFLAVHKESLVSLSCTAPYLPDIPFLDTLFTPLVSFFVAAFGTDGQAAPSYPITLDFVWSFGAAIQLPLIEAARLASSPSASSSTSKLSTMLLSIPMAWGFLYQRVSGGWILPLWLLVWMHSRVRSTPRPLERVRAEGVLVGWWAGHTLPALAMLVPGLPPLRAAPVWIAFPILMSGASTIYTTLVPKSATRRGTSGYVMTQLTYLSALALGAIAHAHVVLVPGLAATTVDASMSRQEALMSKLRGLTGHLWKHYVPPSFAIPSPEQTTAASGVQHFVQFDVLVVFAAVWIAGIWDLALRRPQPSRASMSSFMAKWTALRWAAGVALLLLTIGVFFGPGVSTALLFAYREKMLEMERRRERQDSGMQASPVDVLVKVADEKRRLIDATWAMGTQTREPGVESGTGLAAPIPVRGRRGVLGEKEKGEYVYAMRSPNRWSPTKDYFHA
ncbi:hypothetical protein EIP86_003012 [Pleurotus ostreatoroseus]|nr:hypothetical protein EIP86_003012 [Pleurotus ostreatoroseus]